MWEVRLCSCLFRLLYVHYSSDSMWNRMCVSKFMSKNCVHSKQEKVTFVHTCMSGKEKVGYMQTCIYKRNLAVVRVCAYVHTFSIFTLHSLIYGAMYQHLPPLVPTLQLALDDLYRFSYSNRIYLFLVYFCCCCCY